MSISYTPGVDLDNTVLTAGTNLGNGDLATGLTGGTGLYNVYITWSAATMLLLWPTSPSPMMGPML